MPTMDLARLRGKDVPGKKFRELSPILTFKGASLQLKDKISEICVKSCVMYGSAYIAVRTPA